MKSWQLVALAGVALLAVLHVLTTEELPEDFDLAPEWDQGDAAPAPPAPAEPAKPARARVKGKFVRAGEAPAAAT